MAPRWPQVNNGPEHINEHATYLREACNQLQAADKGRTNQIPWNIVQPYIESTIVLIGKVLQQPSMREISQQIQDAAKGIQTIQRDITVVKSSVGVSTAPLNATNFNGSKAVATSWAQVVAQAKGSVLPPPPAQQGPHISKTSATVTAYKDRVVIVKLKDHGIAQRYRNHSAAWARQQIQTIIRDHTATRLIKVVAAHQLKSGDIQIFASTTTETTQLKENKGWLKGLGECAELVVPTYGVIVHGVATNSINIKDQQATIQQVVADNYTVIPNAEISYVGWLTKEGPLKQASSIVVEFVDPEMANAIIYAGMAWDGQIHQCQLYDRACRVKQCFRCYNYGHIGTQCNASQTCGYCTEQHETKHCRQKGVKDFVPRCTVCKGAHTAWSIACPARKKEMGRVEQAKQLRSTYWHVPRKENITAPSTDKTRNISTIQEVALRVAPAPAQTMTQRPEEAMRPIASGTGTFAQAEPEALPVQAPAPTQASLRAQPPLEVATTQAPVFPSVEEEWTTPATQQRPTPQQLNPPIDSQVRATEESFSPSQVLEERQPQPYSYPLEGIEGAFATQDADSWLDNLFNNDGNEWMPSIAEAEPSPPTSMATEPRTALRKIFKGCKCLSHQEIYNNWPTRNAELTIATCMKTCVYCGSDFTVAAELRKHLRGKKYTQRNISIQQETRGKWSSTTPTWAPRPHVGTPNHRPGSEPPTRPSNARATRSQFLTNSANAAPRL